MRHRGQDSVAFVSPIETRSPSGLEQRLGSPLILETLAVFRQCGRQWTCVAAPQPIHPGTSPPPLAARKAVDADTAFSDSDGRDMPVSLEPIPLYRIASYLTEVHEVFEHCPG